MIRPSVISSMIRLSKDSCVVKTLQVPVTVIVWVTEGTREWVVQYSLDLKYPVGLLTTTEIVSFYDPGFGKTQVLFI